MKNSNGSRTKFFKFYNCFFKKNIYAIFFSVKKKVKGEEKISMGEEKKLFSVKRYMQIFSYAVFLKE